MNNVYDHIANHVSRTVGHSFDVMQRRPVSGGCISRAVLLQGQQKNYFVKLNHIDQADMFDAEAEGISSIENTRSLRVPHPICWGSHDDTAYLVLEYVQLGRAGLGTMQSMGAGLAALHLSTAPRFGWHRDNTIGLTPQPNTYSDRWVDFLREYRLGHQFRLAAANGLPAAVLTAGEDLLRRLDEFFQTYDPAPSLLHGDLWAGNFAADSTGNPIIFDPAVYFGDREADLAMTELFGGFDREFYASYQAAWPLDQGYRVRKTLYNLYHVLNHFNLFGGGYGTQAGAMLSRLLAELC